MGSVAYYNEIDPFCCDWLRNLIKEGLLPNGDVDDRRIEEVEPGDLIGYTSCHFFAGIGGWPYALRLAGWPDDGPVWTGSCPCQPFSSAGKRGGFYDPRHLWPAWFRFIRECRPVVVFGEQVASKAGLAWFDTVSTELEAEAYTVGATCLPATLVGAPHSRERLWFVAHTSTFGRRSCDVVSNLRREKGTSGKETIWCSDRNLPQIRPQNREVFEGWNSEPEPKQMVDGLSDWASCLRAYGNAIVPQVGAEFVAACIEALR